MNDTRHAASSLPPAKRNTRYNLPGWSIPSGNPQQSGAHVPASWIATAGALKRRVKERVGHGAAYKSGIDGRIGRLRFFASMTIAWVLYALSLITLDYFTLGKGATAIFVSALAVFFIVFLFSHRILAHSPGWATTYSLIALGLMFILRNSGMGVLFASTLSIAATVTFIVIGISIVAKRFHDIGLSGWWILLLFALSFKFNIVDNSLYIGLYIGNSTVHTVLVFLMVLFLHLMPGSRGDNEYGPLPPENGTGVIILAIMAILLDIVLVAQGIRA
jgi:uncharacterized membrane protein YhaH (DUF805 family)